MNLAQDAARWVVLLDARLARMEDVIRWSDEQIIAATRPHPDLIEISTSGANAFYEVPSYLRELSRTVNRFDALRYALPTFRRAIETGTMCPESVAWYTYCHLSCDCSKLPEDLRPLYVADDEFYLAIEEKYGDRNDVERRFLAALQAAERF